MGTRSTPPPGVHRPREKTDDSWDELVLGALTSAPPAPAADPKVFERATTIPTSPPGGGSGLELDLNSDPPRAAPGALTRVEPRREERQGRQTMREPVLGRHQSRDETDSTDIQFGEDPPEPGLEADAEQSSPLGLVETYRRSTASLPGDSGAPEDSEESVASESGTREDMQARYAVGDFTGALIVAESMLEANPDNADAKRYAQSCREVLTQMYAARIGPMDQVAVVAVPPEQITWLSLDHRAGFLLSLVDGVSSIEEILDVSGMSRLDALRILYTLYQQNVITLSHH